MSALQAFPEFDLTGRVAIVTGGNGGIGRGIALGLARAGADIAIAARNAEKTSAVTAEIEGLGRRAVGLTCDITREDDIKAAVMKARESLGRIDILVNNAAIFGVGPPYSAQDFDGVMAVNLRGPFLFSLAVLAALRESGGGKIINISSGAGLISYPQSAAYGMSKAALQHLTRTLAAAWAKEHIQVNCIAPGAFDTNMRGGPYEQWQEYWLPRIPAGRTGEPEEFAGIAVFLASRASDYLTGQIIAFDGGVVLKQL